MEQKMKLPESHNAGVEPNAKRPILSNDECELKTHFKSESESAFSTNVGREEISVHRLSEEEVGTMIQEDSSEVKESEYMFMDEICNEGEWGEMNDLQNLEGEPLTPEISDKNPQDAEPILNDYFENLSGPLNSFGNGKSDFSDLGVDLPRVNQEKNEEIRNLGKKKLILRLRNFKNKTGADETELLEKVAEMVAAGEVELEESVPVLVSMASKKISRPWGEKINDFDPQRLQKVIKQVIRLIVQKYGRKGLFVFSQIIKSVKTYVLANHISCQRMPYVMQKVSEKFLGHPILVQELVRAIQNTTGGGENLESRGKKLTPNDTRKNIAENETILLGGPVTLIIQKKCWMCGDETRNDNPRS